MSLSVAPITDETIDLLGKNCDDLQDNISVTNGTISGKLLHVDDYTGYDPTYCEGYYLALQVEDADPDAVITVEVINGMFGPATLDSDRMCILKISNTNTQRVKFTYTKDETTETKVFSLTTLVLDPQ